MVIFLGNMKTHPFEPLISKSTRKLLIGTLPPEGVKFYFSNSSNTRLWDILNALDRRQNSVGRGGNLFEPGKKMEILDNLGLGIADVIYQYDREVENSTKDSDIIPKKYKDLLQLSFDHEITELLFVYQSAYKWFLHSLKDIDPVKLSVLSSRHFSGIQPDQIHKERLVKCTLLPAPLNRGPEGHTLEYKLNFYRIHIM